MVRLVLLSMAVALVAATPQQLAALKKAHKVGKKMAASRAKDGSLSAEEAQLLKEKVATFYLEQKKAIELAPVARRLEEDYGDDALAHDSCAESGGNFLCSHDPNYRTTCEEGTSGLPPTCEDGSRACCCDVDGTCVDGDDDWCCHGDEYEDTPCADCCDGGALRRARRALKFGMHTVSGGDGAKDAGDCATCAC